VVFKLFAKFVVAGAIFAVPMLLLRAVDVEWAKGFFFWGFMAFVVGCYWLFIGASWLLRKALIFLGMSPATADMDCGSPGYGWWH